MLDQGDVVDLAVVVRVLGVIALRTSGVGRIAYPSRNGVAAALNGLLECLHVPVVQALTPRG